MASRWSTRADWGARSPRGVRTDIDPVGVAVHWYGGGSFKRANHKDCLALVKAAQNQHMSDPGVNDIMYNLACCWHGYVIEARSTRDRPRVRSGANGTAAANARWYAILALWGKGDGDPDPGLLNALRDGIDWLRDKGGAGSRLSGHRDHVSTECPGDKLYAWAKSGAPRPGGSIPQPKPAPQEGNVTCADVLKEVKDARRALGERHNLRRKEYEALLANIQQNEQHLIYAREHLLKPLHAKVDELAATLAEVKAAVATLLDTRQTEKGEG